MAKTVIHAVNEARKDIQAESKMPDFDFLEGKFHKYLYEFYSVPHVEALLQAIRKKKFSSPALEDLNFSGNSTMLLGFFKISYNKAAIFEAAAFTPIELPRQLLAVYPESLAMPVQLDSATDGMNGDLAVAIFPENYMGVVPKPEYRTYYFVNKFMKRLFNFTIPAVKSFWEHESFPFLGELEAYDVKMLISMWVYLHEYFHQTGPLPFALYRNEKSTTKDAAALEELRVDLSVVIAFSDLAKEGCDIFSTAAQLVFAERLIRYPLQIAPAEGYDARASVAFFEHLKQNDAISTDGAKYKFKGGFNCALNSAKSLLQEINEIERKVSTQPPETIITSLSQVIPRISGVNKVWHMPEMHERMRKAQLS